MTDPSHDTARRKSRIAYNRPEARAKKTHETLFHPHRPSSYRKIRFAERLKDERGEETGPEMNSNPQRWCPN
jgi:hypothetical protein